ncbi:unnamed protein product [Fraxinus pennsylvanica]|uniref:Uncharacterized protein n=1 Tax=Fraxinus pennsylvanica TaxID=56036 RepID=A0AAD1ZUV9_9LAMI|nr:unnamed protein product [Fraxinus pennsylvanica]
MGHYNQQQQHQLKSKSKSSSLPERRGGGVGSSLDDGATPSKTNLDWFLEHTTPTVVAQCFPQTSVRGWRNSDSELQPYFILGDLWDSFWEWSVYGAEVHLVLNGNDSVVHMCHTCLLCNSLILLLFYGLNIVAGNLERRAILIHPRRRILMTAADVKLIENTNNTRGIWNQQNTNNTRGIWNQKNTTGQGYNRLPVRNKPFAGLSVDEGDISSPPGRLIFEHLEQDLPFCREPLADKASPLIS